MPSAKSMLMAPVEIASVGAMAFRWPSRMIEPLPNCFSICPTATSSALMRSCRSSTGMLVSSVSVELDNRAEVPRPGFILETVQAKVKRKSSGKSPFDRHVFNDLRG